VTVNGERLTEWKTALKAQGLRLSENDLAKLICSEESGQPSIGPTMASAASDWTEQCVTLRTQLEEEEDKRRFAETQLRNKSVYWDTAAPEHRRSIASVFLLHVYKARGPQLRREDISYFQIAAIYKCGEGVVRRVIQRLGRLSLFETIKNGPTITEGWELTRKGEAWKEEWERTFGSPEQDVQPEQSRVQAMSEMQPYEARQDDGGPCPDCYRATTLLRPAEGQATSLPSFLVCRCGFVGQIGVKRLASQRVYVRTD